MNLSFYFGRLVTAVQLSELRRPANGSGDHYILSFPKKDGIADCKLLVMYDHILCTAGTRFWYEIKYQVR